MLPIPHLFAAFCALCLSCLAVSAEGRVSVFAAASLKEALDDVAEAYGNGVVVSYGGSGTIARQVAAGAPADVVILANQGWMDWLAERGAVRDGSRRDLLGNRLVLIAPARSEDLKAVNSDTLMARLDGGRLALGQTRGVPAGIYGRQWLERAGLWPALASHLAETDNVRSALALVSRGEAPLGLVYSTDARADAGVQVLYEVPEGLHAPILYPMALSTYGTGQDTAGFVAYLVSDEAAEIFRAHGFIPRPGP